MNQLIWPKILAAGLVMTLAGCAPPKANFVSAAPVEKKPQRKVERVAVAVPDLPTVGLPDDGIRMPEMLNLPNEGDFRASNPTLPSSPGQGGAVISRPPTDPPSRVKPPAAAAE